MEVAKTPLRMWVSYRNFVRYACVDILHDKTCGEPVHKAWALLSR